MSVKVLKPWIMVACKAGPPPALPSPAAQLPGLILIVAALWVFLNDKQLHPLFPQPLQPHWHFCSWEQTPLYHNQARSSKLAQHPLFLCGKDEEKAQSPEASSWNLPKVSFLPGVVHTGRSSSVLGNLP